MPRGRLLPDLHSRRTRLAAAAGAVVLTGSAVAVGTLVPGSGAAPSEQPDLAAAGSLRGAAVDLSAVEDREVGTSRSEQRAPVVAPRTPEVQRKLWTTEPLKLRVQPAERSRDVGTVAEDEKLGVTGKRSDGYAEVVVDDKARWVSAAYLSRTKEKDPAPAPSGAGSGSTSEDGTGSAGLDTGACSNGAVASGGLQPQAQTVMNAVCNAFPEISTYGGYAPRGEHGGGLAVDVMVSGATGDAVAQFLYAHRGELGLSNIIWAQTIWSSERDGEGFRGMEDRGSTTANHYDHVHVLAG